MTFFNEQLIVNNEEFRIGSAYDRFINWVWATPTLNYSLFILHFSFNQRVWATPTLNYSFFTKLFIKLFLNLLVCCKHFFCCSGSCSGELSCEFVI